MVPFGKAKVVQAGTDLTVILTVQWSPGVQAVQKLEREHGVKAELIDLRSLNPSTGRPLQPRCKRPAGPWWPMRTP